MGYRGFADEDEYLEALQDAREEDFYNDPHTIECPNCGTFWNEGYHRATRTDPAYVDQEECPKCGMSREEAEEAAAAREEADEDE